MDLTNGGAENHGVSAAGEEGEAGREEDRTESLVMEPIKHRARPPSPGPEGAGLWISEGSGSTSELFFPVFQESLPSEGLPTAVFSWFRTTLWKLKAAPGTKMPLCLFRSWARMLRYKAQTLANAPRRRRRSGGPEGGI